MTRIILDVDTGTDDALAILYAVAHPDLELAGISCVAGNALLPQVVANTLKVLDAAGAGPVPVAAGAAQPLIQSARPESDYHGADGLGGITLPASDRQLSNERAVAMLWRLIMESEEPLTLVALAPQTNLAVLLRTHPEVAERVDRLVFMGGSASGGNITAVAEYNIWQDPEAAYSVLEAGLPTTMYGLDVFNRLVIPESAALSLESAPHPALKLAGQLLQHRGHRDDGTPDAYAGVLGDAGALMLLTEPELFTINALPVRVNLTGIGRGQTVVDRRHSAQNSAELAADPWPVVGVTLDCGVSTAANRFVETLNVRFS